MRKAIIAAIVASALFAVGAFAASFAVSTEDVASGTDAVTKCADLVDVDFTQQYNEDLSDWYAINAVVTFFKYDGDDKVAFTATDDCSLRDFDITLALEDESGGLIDEFTSFDWTTPQQATFDLADVTVGEIGNAAVLTDGVTLFADSANNTANAPAGE